MHRTSYQGLLAEHRARITALSSQDDRFVVNQDWEPFISGMRPHLIAIADNPGANEKTFSKYLSERGRVGKIAHDFFDGVFGEESFGRFVLALNKSSFSTRRTRILTAMLRPNGCSKEKLEAIKADMRANGKLVVQLVAALAVPVLYVGSESDNTFEAFREGVDSERAKVGAISATFAGTTLSEPFHLIPHFSMSKAFCKHRSRPDWNGRIDQFVAKWAHLGAIKTQKGHLSWKTMRDTGNGNLLKDYLLSVLLASAASPAIP